MDLQELLDLLARWADLEEADRTRLNDGIATFVSECTSPDDLATLDEALVGLVDAALDEEGAPTDDGLELLQWIRPVVTAVRERGTELETEATERAAEAQELVDAIRGQAEGDDGGEPGDGEGEGEGAGEAGAEGEGGEGAAGDGEGTGDGEGAGEAGAASEPEAVAAGGAAGAPPAGGHRVTRVAARRPASARPRRAPQADAAPITAAAGVPGYVAGGRIRDHRDGGAAILAMVDAFRAGGGVLNTPVLHQVLDMAQVPADRLLTRDAQENDRKILQSQAPDAIAAAGGFCAPFPVNYDVPGVGVDDRPVKDALNNFAADRGGVRLMEPVKLEELEGSTTIWTAANDADPGSDGPSTKPVLVVECGDEREFEVYGIPQALEFKNFSVRNHPERQAAIMRMAGVHAARVAETKMLTDIGAGSTQVSIGEGLSATRDILTGIDRISAARRSHYRLGDRLPLRRLAPFWERDLIRADLARELPGSTAERLAVADAQIDEFFRVRNINNTYVFDGESGQVFGEQGDGPAAGWPGSIVSYLFVEGTWLALDGGTFNLGVIRDTEMAKRNKFQVWAELVEGTAFQGIWSDRVVHDVCPSGTTSGTVDFDPCSFGS